MDISGVSIPATPPAVQAATPRDAQMETAVPEAAQGGSAENNPQADTGASGGGRDESSNVGRNIDERA
jgi:hypothetical protein